MSGVSYTIMGWNYLAARSDHLNQLPYPADGAKDKKYKTPHKLDDIKDITSRNLLTCIIYNAASPGMSWESIAPHAPGNTARFIPSGSGWIVPDGIHVADIDASAGFKRFQTLTAVGGGDWYYFHKD